MFTTIRLLLIARTVVLTCLPFVISSFFSVSSFIFNFLKKQSKSLTKYFTKVTTYLLKLNNDNKGTKSELSYQPYLVSFCYLSFLAFLLCCWFWTSFIDLVFLLLTFFVGGTSLLTSIRPKLHPYRNQSNDLQTAQLPLVRYLLGCKKIYESVLKNISS